MRPPGADEHLGLGGAGGAGDEEGGAGGVGAGEQDVAGVRVGRAGLGVAVVAVVPDREQAGVLHRGEGGGPGTDGEALVAPRHGEPAAVALGGAEVGGQGGHLVLAQELDAGGVEAVEVAPVGHDDHRPVPGADRGAGGLGEATRPVLPGQRLPDGVGARRRARASRKAGPRG